jgi:hypothetical protein
MELCFVIRSRETRVSYLDRWCNRDILYILYIKCLIVFVKSAVKTVIVLRIERRKKCLRSVLHEQKPIVNYVYCEPYKIIKILFRMRGVLEKNNHVQEYPWFLMKGGVKGVCEAITIIPKERRG